MYAIMMTWSYPNSDKSKFINKLIFYSNAYPPHLVMQLIGINHFTLALKVIINRKYV